MAMGGRIISRSSCVLIVFVMLAIISSSPNCEAERSLLQTSLLDSLTPANIPLTGILTVILNGNDTIIGIFNGKLNGVGGLVGTMVFTRNGTWIGTLTGSAPLNNIALAGVISNGTQNGTVSALGPLNNIILAGMISNGKVVGTLTSVGPFNDIDIAGVIGEDHSGGTMHFTVIGVGTINGVTDIPITGNGKFNVSGNGEVLGIGMANVTFPSIL